MASEEHVAQPENETPGEVAPATEAPAPTDAAAAEGSASEAPSHAEGETDGDDDGAEGEDEAREGAAEGEGPDAQGKKKRKRRKKKPARAESRPATERAPFRVGEDVFGKVTAVLPTAIMVDLAGKALGIFDRGEMAADDLVPEPGDAFVTQVHGDGSRGGLVVLTRKPLRAEETKPLVEAAAKAGAVVMGLVTGVIKGGLEVDVAGLRAFAPASGVDLHPARANLAALVGQQLDFKVAEYKNNGRDVVVTRRPMLEAEAHERRKAALQTLEPGQKFRGIVRSVVEWGAFVALPDASNLEGLVHASELSHDANARVEDLLKPGDELEVQIQKIDERGKIWLSRKALVADPWGELTTKYRPHTVYKGKVVRLEPFGAFVELEPGVEGLLHIADLAFERVENISDVLTVGQELDVIIAHADSRSRKLLLHPALTGDRANEAPQKVARGAALQVEVVRIEGHNVGVVVRVLGHTGRGQRGFLPAAQTGLPKGADLRKQFPAGRVLNTKVIEVDPRRDEPKLSIRALDEDEERKATRDYRKQLSKDAGFGTLGDLLRTLKPE